MEDTIQIKCPFDGAILTVKNQPGLESKNVTCPICKHKYAFTQFKRVAPSPANQEEEKTQFKSENKIEKLTVGCLKNADGTITYPLEPGQNIIGRNATNSNATIKIDTGDKRSMSREHIIIDVKKVEGKGMVHYISLFKEKVNATFIGNEPLYMGDTVVLKHGDIIRLPDISLIFEIPDEEETIYNN